MTTDKQVVDSLTTQGKGMPENSAPPQTIIPTCKFSAGGIIPSSIRQAVGLDLPGETIIPPKVDGGVEGIIPFSDPLLDKVVAAEHRRQTVQAEAMVNLAVGVVALKMSTHGMRFVFDNTGIPDKFRISITPQDLAAFQRDFLVGQELSEDGGFIISVDRR